MIRNVFLLFLLSVLSTYCKVFVHEDMVAKFEQKLTAKVGKMTNDVKQEYGEPTKYSNTSPIDADDIGAFMIYEKNDDCTLVFKYSKKTLKILDWSYSGDCFDR